MAAMGSEDADQSHGLLEKQVTPCENLQSQRQRQNQKSWPLIRNYRTMFIASMATLTSLLLLSSLFYSNGAELHLTHNDTFQIAVFSDLHYGENESTFGIPADKNSAAFMKQVLAQEDPDFVVLNGDLITGENTFAFNSTQYVHQIVAPLVQSGYKWASTYGNHDSKYNLSREALFAEEKKYSNSLTQHGPVGTDGVTNYVLPVFSPDASKKPVALLWFFDSRGGSEYQSVPANVDNIDNYVSDGTIAWFRSKQSDMQQEHGPLPSLAFVHIPTLAFADLQASTTSPKVSSANYPGLNADIPLAHQGYSNTGSEAIPFMKALLDTPDLHSIYSGHDHGDSWCGRWPNATLPDYGLREGSSRSRPFLCFCKHSGYGGYGVWNRGVRQVRMKFDERGVVTVDTWVRMQDGSVITAVSLNGTYGEDVYPVADGE